MKELIAELWEFYDEQKELNDGLELHKNYNRIYANGCESVLDDLRNKLAELEDKYL